MEIIRLNRAISELQYGGEAITIRLITPILKDPQPENRTTRSAAQVTYSSAKKLFLLDILPIVLLFIIPMFAHAGFFSALAGLLATETETQDDPVMVLGAPDRIELLRAATNPNPPKGGGDIIVDEYALVPDSGPLDATDATKVKETNGEISIYVVREGDTLSQIADMFDVTTNTILWANSTITKETGIQPGDELLILPITGVRHIVKSGDTMQSLVKKYYVGSKAEDTDAIIADILAYNQLEKGSSLSVGSTVIIPGGEVEAPKETPKKSKGGTALSGGGAVSAGSSYYSNPVPGSVRTQGIHGYNGVDLGAPAGTPVKAAASGQVITAKSSGWNGGYGSYIVVKHPNGTQTLYAHLSSISIGSGTTVAKGQVIGAVGSTGKSTGNHLHFEVRGARNPF